MCFYFIFISDIFIHTGNEYLKYTRFIIFCHLVYSAIPVIKITNNADTYCLWRPYHKVNTFYTINIFDVSSHIFVHIIAAAIVIFFYESFSKLCWILVRVVIYNLFTMYILYFNLVRHHSSARNTYSIISCLINFFHRISLIIFHNNTSFNRIRSEHLYKYAF